MKLHLVLSALLVLTALIAAAPLFVDPGYLITRGAGESPNLLFRVHQLLRAYQAGEFPPRWAADAAYGYGMPYFTYYASFSTHVAAVFKVLGGSYPLSIKLAQFTALLAGAAGTWVWVIAGRRWPRDDGRSFVVAVLAAVAYTFAPFHLVNLYIRGDSLAELWAMGVFPWLLWAVSKASGQPAGETLGWPAGLPLALLTAVLVCTHNVSALVMLPLAALYALVLAAPGPSDRLAMSGARPITSVIRAFGTPVARVAAAMALGLGLSAFFWLPALAEGGAVQLNALTTDFFNYRSHFRAFDLVQTAPTFDYANHPFALGLVQTLLALGGLLVALLRWRSWTRWHTFNALALGLTLFLITPLSQPAYDHLPLLAYVQFPWRLLSLAALFTAVWTGELAFRATKGPTVRTPDTSWQEPAMTCRAFGLSALRPFGPPGLWSLGLSILLAYTALVGLRPQFVSISDDDVSAWRLQLYEVASTMIGNTANNEYLPAAVTPRPYMSDVVLRRSPSPLGASGVRVEKRGAYEQWRLQVEAAGSVSVPTYFWPGWRGQVDGRALDLRAAPGLGWITFELPAGEHEITLWLDRTPLRAGAEVLSAASLGGWIVLLVGSAGRKHGARRAAVVVGGVAVTALGAMAFVFGARAVLLDPVSPVGGPPVQFDYLRWVYPARTEILFAAPATSPARSFAWWAPSPLTEAAVLESVTGLVERAEPGQQLDLKLIFRDGYPASVTVGLYPSAAATHELPPLVSDTAPLTLRSPIWAESDATLTLTLPPDLAPGLYWLSPTLDGERGPEGALLPNGDVRGRVFLGPILVDRPPRERASPMTANLLGAQVALDHSWAVSSRVPVNAGVALRLIDATGEVVGAIDTQPGYGFLPSVMWRPGERIHDRIVVPLAEGTPPGVYTATARLYEVSTFATLLEESAPVEIAPVWPRGARTATIRLGAGLELERVEVPTEAEAGTALTVTGHWLTGAALPGRQRAIWRLVDDQGQVVLGVEADLTTEAWAAQAYVRVRQRLAVPLELAAGVYRLQVQLGGQQADLGPVSVRASTRQFTPPEMGARLDARFGESLSVLGYTPARSAQGISVDLVYQAVTVPAANYTYFVHLIAPDGAVVDQVDRQPRDGAYPTTGWLPGEIVVETVAFDLSDRPPGLYRLGLGWYDGSAPGLPRVPVFAADGTPIGEDRLIVLEVVVGP